MKPDNLVPAPNTFASDARNECFLLSRFNERLEFMESGMFINDGTEQYVALHTLLIMSYLWMKSKDVYANSRGKWVCDESVRMRLHHNNVRKMYICAESRYWIRVYQTASPQAQYKLC